MGVEPLLELSDGASALIPSAAELRARRNGFCVSVEELGLVGWTGAYFVL